MKLKDFYKQSVDMNERVDVNGIRIDGWASMHYGVFSSVINENNYKKIAEIGVGYGTHAKYILNHCKDIEQLYLVDPMIDYPNDHFSLDIMNQEANIPGNNFNELYELINDYLQPYQNYTWHRKKSLEITNAEIADSSLDAVFIDGAHDYDNVLADLIFWSKKIKPGGQILGDDFWIEDIKRAVNFFSTSTDMAYDLLRLPHKEYYIYRFKL